MLIIVAAMIFPNTVYAIEINSDRSEGAEILKEKINSIKEEREKELSSEKAKKNRISSETHQKLMKEIRVDNKYPSYYGGAYIDDKNDLVVVLVEKSEVAKEKVRKACGNVNVQFVDGNVSFEYLKNLQECYSKRYEQLYLEKEEKNLSILEKELLKCFAGSYIDEKNNELVLEIKGITSDKIEVLKSLFGNDKYVRFENGGDMDLSATEWRVGRMIHFTNSSGKKDGISTGYRAYFIDDNGNRYNGFVTAGHAVKTGQYVYTSATMTNANLLGLCMVSYYQNGIDGAFVAINNINYQASNTTYYSNNTGSTTGSLVDLLPTTIATDSDFIQNMLVFFVGGVSYLKSGKIISGSYTHYELGHTYSDIVTTTIPTQNGDSGGCLFLAKNGGFATGGTLMGELPYGASEMSCFSKAARQISWFGITKY